MRPAGRRGMPKRTFRIREGEPLLDIASYGRGGPRETGGSLTPAQLEQIRRTVRRTPEVVVKVLPRASNDLKAVGKHLDYIGRKGELEVETDDGEHLGGRIGKISWMTGISTSTTCGAKQPSPPRRVESRRSSSISSCSRCRLERLRTKCWGRYETSRGRNFGANTDTHSPCIPTNLILTSILC